MTLKTYFLPTILLITSSFVTALGQSQSQYDKGTPPQLAAGVSSLSSYMSTELGTVNLSNGGLNINIPLGTVGGRGNVSVPLTLSYSSKVWSASKDVDTERESGTEQEVAYADYDNQSSFGGASAPGWTLREGMYMSVRFVKIKKITSGPNIGCYTYGLHKLTLNLPDRGEVEFRDDATDGAPLLLNCTTQQTASRGTRWHATDGSGAIFINDVDNGVGLFPSPNLSGTIILANGTRLGSTTNGAILDRNGNKITGTTNGWMDQLGRITTIQYGVTDPDNSAVTLALLITIPGYQGAPRYYKVKTGIMSDNYRSGVTPTFPVITSDWDPEGWGYNWGTATRLFSKSYGLYAQRIDDREVLTEIELPDERILRFKYNEFGEVAEIELPTGGKIQYDYGYRSALPSGNSPSWETGTNGSGSGIATDVKWVDRAVIAKRTYPDGTNLEGTWIFGYGAHVVGGTTYPSTTVAVNSNASELLSRERHIFLPAGRFTEPPGGGASLHDGTHYSLWSTGVEWRTETLDAAGNVLAAVEQDWSQRAPVSWSSYPTEQIQKDNRVSQTRRYLETGMMAKVETFYDQYNNPIEVKEYDYDQTLKRRTTTTYLSTNNGFNYQTDDSIHLLRLPAEQTIYDGSGNQVAKTVTEYDVYINDGNRNVLTGYPTVSQHHSAYGTAKTTRGNPTRIGVWRNTTASFIYTYPRYDIVGNVVSLKDALGNVSTISFADDFGNGSNPGTPSQNPATPTYSLPTLITSPPPVPGAPVHAARSQYDYSTGLLTGFRDRNNVITQTIYNDPFNRPTLVKSALGISGIESHSVMCYAPGASPCNTISSNETLIATDQTTLGDRNLRSWTVTDGFGRPKESWQSDPQGNVKIRAIHDALGRTKQVSNPYRPSLGEAEVFSTTSFDLLGRVTTVTGPDNSIVSTSYSANTVTLTDQALKKRKSVTDALGRLKEVYEDPNGLNHLTTYQYDTLDNLITVTQGSQTRTFSYNSLKQLLSANNPESGTISYQYDDAGNLAVKSDARGVSAHYAYDAFSRVTRRWYNASNSVGATTHNDFPVPGVGASKEASYFYDAQTLPAGAPTFSRGAANGRLVAVAYGTSSNTGDYLSYDSAGRNVLKIQRTDNVNYQLSSTLNLAGAPTAMVYPSGRTVTYSYDSSGRLSNFAGNLGDGVQRTYASSFDYNAKNQITRELFGTQTPLYHKRQYNIRGQLWDVRVSTGSDVNGSWNRGCLQFFYESTLTHGASGPDNNGNVLKASHYVPLDEQTNTWAIPHQLYSYDALNRLASVTDYFMSNTQPLTQQSVQSYTYDRWGNRTINPATWGTGINNKQFTVNATNNRLGVPVGQSGVMSYDVAGNLTNDTYTGAGDRTYDAENKITSAWGGNNQAQLYAYDAAGQRIKRTVDGVQTWQVYGLGGELVAEYPVGGVASNPQKEYGYRSGQLLITASGAPRINVAAAANGGTATASQTHSAPYAPSGAINGDRKLYLNNAWANSTATFPQWLQVDFNGSKTIDEIDVFSVQDLYAAPSEPTPTMTFSLYGVTAFQAQYWNGSTWVTVTNGSVTGNNKVWKQITFPAITTTKIRIWITGSSDGYSRLTEVEAWGPSGGGGSPTAQWLVPDHLGTPRIIIDQTGSLANVKRHDYLPFGEELFAPTGGRTAAMGYASGDGVRQQFTAYERDAETQLDYAKARYYSSTQGRFTSPDPLLASGRPAVPQSWNRYTYVLNSPLVLIDPDGLDWGVAEWIDDEGRLQRNYHYFDGKVGEYKGRQYEPVAFNSSGYLDINADDGTTVRISNTGILRQVIYAGPAGGSSSTAYQDLNLAAGFVDGSIPFGRRLREAAFGQMGIDTSAPEYQNAAIISEGVSIGATVVATGGMRIPGCLVQVTTGPTRIYSARVLLRSADDTGPYHNFPESFNAEIFNGSRTATTNFFRVDKQGLTNDSVLYTAPGSVNGTTGTFEIGVRPSVSGRTEVIMHRFFRPDKTQ